VLKLGKEVVVVVPLADTAVVLFPTIVVIAVENVLVPFGPILVVSTVVIVGVNVGECVMPEVLDTDAELEPLRDVLVTGVEDDEGIGGVNEASRLACAALNSVPQTCAASEKSKIATTKRPLAEATCVCA